MQLFPQDCQCHKLYDINVCWNRDLLCHWYKTDLTISLVYVSNLSNTLCSILGFKAHAMHKECLKHQDNSTLLRLFNTTEPDFSIIPHAGEDVTYWINGSKITRPMPNITICNLQDELDKVLENASRYNTLIVNSQLWILGFPFRRRQDLGWHLSFSRMPSISSITPHFGPSCSSQCSLRLELTRSSERWKASLRPSPI